MNSPLDRSPRPRKVRHAVGMLYASLGIGVVQACIKASSPAGLSGTSEMNDWVSVFSVPFILVVLALLAMLFSGIGQGLNWARITFLVLFVVGTPTLPGNMTDSFHLSTFSGALCIIQACLQLWALILLFQSDSSAWFRRQSVQASAPLRQG